MFPLIPALILLLLHGPANFDKLAASGRLPASMAVFRSSAEPETPKLDASRRALATLIAASGDRALTAAFASMFLAGDSHPAPAPATLEVRDERRPEVFDPEPPPVPEGFSRFVRSRDGPTAH